MKVDVVNTDNEKVGSLELSDEVFGGRVNDALIWESVVHTNASARRGTHKTKNRANVAGSGRKPWKQKGTGRARACGGHEKPRANLEPLPRPHSRRERLEIGEHGHGDGGDHVACRVALGARLHDAAADSAQPLELGEPSPEPLGRARSGGRADQGA
jgi:hypothetical protein